MLAPNKNPGRVVHALTLSTLIIVACIGAVLVIAPVKPFWLDEWFVIYSLKTKSTAALFGQLAFMQQFPRICLVLIKSFTSCFDYSYTSLRLPSYLAGISVIVLSYKLMMKIYDERIFPRYLFVMVPVSSFTFCEYFVEMKQYTMDMLLSVFALWQLTELLNLNERKPVIVSRYVFLCLGFLVVPFFSYIYPIAIAPAYLVVLLQVIVTFKRNAKPSLQWSIITIKILPLLICTASIISFYLLDAKQLATDKCMYERWSFLIINREHILTSFLTGSYTLFSQLGAGIIFETLFGALGIISFLYGTWACLRNCTCKDNSTEAWIRLYSCALLLLTLILYACKKMPLGTPRLNVFTVPSITILIIYFVSRTMVNIHGSRQKNMLPIVLYLGVTGNIYSHYFNYFTSPEYRKQMIIYNASQNAIRFARTKKIPILITAGITYPYGADTGTWVLKTLPEYKMAIPIPVYALADMNSIDKAFDRLPENVVSALAGDGISFRLVYRSRQDR